MIIIILCPNKLKNWFLSRTKALGIRLPKSDQCYNINPISEDRIPGLWRRRKTNFSICLGIFISAYFTACTPQQPQVIVDEPTKPEFSIQGHYSETIGSDPETMRRAVEIQSVIAKEKIKMGIE